MKKVVAAAATTATEDDDYGDNGNSTRAYLAQFKLNSKFGKTLLKWMKQ